MEGPLAHWIMCTLCSKSRRHVEGQTYVMTYGRPFRYFAIGMTVALPVLVVLITPIDPELQNIQTFWYVFRGACLFGGIPGLLLCNEGFRSRIEVDTESIKARSAWTGKKQVRWDGIASITFTQGSEWFVIRPVKGRCIRVPILLDGIGRFIDDFRASLPHDRWNNARVGIDRVNSLHQ